MHDDRRLTGWLALGALLLVVGTLTVIASHRDKGWSETGTIIYELGFVLVLAAVPVVVGLFARSRPAAGGSEPGPGARAVRPRISSLAMIIGGAGMSIGKALAEFSPPGPVWTSTAAFPMALIVIALATWNLLAPGPAKLAAIGLLTAAGLLFTTFDPGAAPPVWDRGYAGVELFGIWLFYSSAAAVLLGVVGSSVIELRPDAAASASGSPGWSRRRGFVVAGVVVALWAVGFAVSNIERLQASEENDAGDRGPPGPDAWTVDPDGAGSGVPSIHMVRTFSRLDESDVDDVSGRLVWAETEVDVCGVEIRAAGDGFVQIGDIFAVGMGCDEGSQMRDAFERFGTPQTACVVVRSDDVDDEYCAPLSVEETGDRGP